MFVIEASNEKGARWISAICSERSPAEAFLTSVPDRVRATQKVVDVPHKAYPLFILEKGGFQYGDANFVRNSLATLTPSGSEDVVHMNIYVVREDFLPSNPGTDSMGNLFHWHVTDDDLASPRGVLRALGIREVGREHRA